MLSLPECRRSTMAVMNLESLALRAQSTTGLHVAGTTRTDSNNPANGLTPVSMSSGRHPAPQFPRAEVQPRSRRYWVDANVDVDSVGMRAGRSGSFTGILVRRSPAIPAGLAGRSLGSTAGWSKRHCQGLSAAFVGQRLSERSITPPLWAERPAGSRARLRSQPLSKRGAVQAAWSMPQGGTFPASTRGKG
jgi:hypothetical protein